jgi:Fic family protein
MVMSSFHDRLARIDALRERFDRMRPFAGDTLDALRAYYRLALTWTSNAVEGCSYTESETKVLIEDGITVGGKTLRDTFMVLGHAKAYEFMFDLRRKGGLSEADLLAMHGLLDGGLDAGRPGKYRDVKIYVTGTTHIFPSPRAIPGLMRALFSKDLPVMRGLHPVERAIRLHYGIVDIHPFADGNGRVARLAMNASLVQDGFLPIQVHPVIRKDYVDAIRDWQLHGDQEGFLSLLAQQEVESLKEILRMFEDAPADGPSALKMD